MCFQQGQADLRRPKRFTEGDQKGDQKVYRRPKSAKKATKRQPKSLKATKILKRRPKVPKRQPVKTNGSLSAGQLYRHLHSSS